MGLVDLCSSVEYFGIWYVEIGRLEWHKVNDNCNHRWWKKLTKSCAHYFFLNLIWERCLVVTLTLNVIVRKYLSGQWRPNSVFFTFRNDIWKSDSWYWRYDFNVCWVNCADRKLEVVCKYLQMVHKSKFLIIVLSKIGNWWAFHERFTWMP